MGVTQHLGRRLGVARLGSGVQGGGHGALALGAALLFGVLRDGVHLAELAVLDRRHASGECQAVALEPQLGSRVDRLQTRLSGGQRTRVIGQ